MIKLFVTTFSHKAIMRHMLEEYVIYRYVHDIITPASIGKREGMPLKDKNELIKYGMDQYCVKTPLLIDHNPYHVDAAKIIGHGYNLDFHNGITVRDVARIASIIGRNKVDGIFVGVDDTVFDGRLYDFQCMTCKDGCQLIV